MMRAEKYWDHEPFFAYVDRWMTEDHAKELKEFKAACEENKKISFPNWWENLIKTCEAKKPQRTFAKQLGKKYSNDLSPPKEQGK